MSDHEQVKQSCLPEPEVNITKSLMKIHPKALILYTVNQSQMIKYHSEVFVAQLPFVGETLSSVKIIIT